ncbi:HlyD family secretion protein [Phyllobacterium meliloti]|uniref:HlyD family secretion protein n=1 Tax=Phyllobacterium meliloti TaxID=555317 RepID=UPI001D159972|nr:HlyD family efflux transporter periplasmic adaptor subunit [Phyllobacterium sp. T1293]UGX88451.1 HlyD family efflux transporter periplasmic adaptor subunit [Phyllobacterium sp. T1293]
MKRLHKHPRIDTLGKQQRATSGKLGRLVYLGLVLIFVGSLGYYLIGGMFVLSIDGTVLKERHAVGASYPGKVIEVYVKEGDKVESGTRLLRLESFDTVKEIANLALRDSELSVREGQLRGKLAAVKTVMPLAERTARESTSTVAQFDTVSGRGIVSALTKDDALRGSLQAAERVADLTSQETSAQIELDLLANSRKISNAAIAQLNGIYDDGYLRASTPGVLGAKVPIPGQVVRFGDELMEINGGKSYILAYLPDQYLFSIEEGMPVNVRSGSEYSNGTIDAILTVADALPDEFQNMFRPRDRSRLVRIALAEKNPFAVSQKVTVSGCGFGYCWAR